MGAAGREESSLSSPPTVQVRRELALSAALREVLAGERAEMTAHDP